MARTRGASTAFHQDDGEVLDKWGKTIPPTPVRGAPTVVHMDDGELVSPPAATDPVAAMPMAYEWLCDRTTWHRSMEAYEAMILMDLYTGGLSVKLSPDDFARLSPDARRHFRRVAKKVEELA